MDRKTSVILRSLGFIKNGENSSNPGRLARFPIFKDTFYHKKDVMFGYEVTKTFAHDEEGCIWQKVGEHDLTAYGFAIDNK